MSAPAAKKRKLSVTKSAHNNSAGALQPQPTETSAVADKLKLFVTKRAIDDLEGTINRMKALSTRFTHEQSQQAFDGLESILKLLIGHTARVMTEYQRLGWVLRLAKVELVAPDALSHELLHADFKAICKIVMPEVALDDCTSADLEVLRDFVAALDVPSHKSRSTSLENLPGMRTPIEKLTGELGQVREELAQVKKTDCAA